MRRYNHLQSIKIFFAIIITPIFLFIFCNKVLAAETVYNFSAGWTTLTGGTNQDFTMYFDLATSSVAFLVYEQAPGSSNCNYTKGRFASANVDGTYFEDITRGVFNSQDYYVGYASSTIPAGIDKQLTIDTNLLPGGGGSCDNHFNLFFVSGVVASSVLASVIDGGNFTSPTNYNFTMTTPEKNPADGMGIFQLAIQGFDADMTTYVATSSFTVINDDDDWTFSSFYQKQPGVYTSTNYRATFTPTPHQSFIVLAQFPLGESIPPENTLTITPITPLCQSLDQVFTLSFTSSMNDWRYYYAFTDDVCSIMTSWDGYRDLNVFNIGQAISTSTSLYGSSTLTLCSYLVDNNGNPVSIGTSNYDVYASTSVECVGSYLTSPYNYWCADVCNGLATSTFGGEIACGARQVGCWSFTPHATSKSYFSASWEALKGSFPFSLYFDLTDALTGFSTSTTATQGFALPVPAMDSNGHATITMETVVNASTSQNTIGKNNYYDIRRAIVWFLWIIAAGYVIFRLSHKHI